jgi:1,4-dihydroxy-2-naphthoyl-CoA hydrolase
MAATGFHTADELNALLPGTLPGLLGIVVTAHEPGRLRRHSTSAPRCSRPTATCTRPPWSGLADTACGLATRALLPEGSTGFTTIELKSNFLGTAREGRIDVVATNVHAGRTTQVWDAVVTARAPGRRSRCSAAPSRCSGRADPG